MNFKQRFLEGQAGKNIGLTTGLHKLDLAIDGIQKKSIITIASEPKCGKTTFVDFCFLLKPYEEMIAKSKSNVHWIYYSLEISRIEKEFKFAAYFMYELFGISSFNHKGKEYQMSPRYLSGRLKDDNDVIIPIQASHNEKLFKIYNEKLIPLFGEFDDKGNKIKEGVIDFIEESSNPTGIQKYIYNYAQNNGKLIHQEYTIKENGVDVIKKRVCGYKPDDPEKMVIFILDHARRLQRQQGFSMKENIDKMSSYEVEMKNLFGYTFVNVIHLNRNISSVERMKFNKETLYPTAEDIKDSGNFGEDCTTLITLFNPRDEKYNLDRHFGVDISQYPNYRSIHLVYSRDTECPKHLQTQMFGNVNYFKQI